jgi:hypothetical protein
MNPSRSLRLVLAATLVAHLCAGCSDVGDNTDVPAQDAAASDSTTDGGVDAHPPTDATQEASPDATSGTDAGADSQERDVGGEAEAAGDAIADAEVDATSSDGAPFDGGSEPSPDAPPDSADGGGLDATVDSGGPDASDGGTPDSAPADAGPDSMVQDAAADVVEAGGVLAPCTNANPTGCVQCQGNNFPPNPTTACTPTEAALVQHDIDRGLATAPGPDPSGACYTCLEQNGCLDDHEFADTHRECEDFSDATSQSQCEAVLACVLGSSCATSAVSTCYCGTAGVSTACQGNPAPGPIDGKCASTIAAGLGFPVTDGTDVTKALTDIAKPAGMADQLFQCAQSNSCTACLQ